MHRDEAIYARSDARGGWREIGRDEPLCLPYVIAIDIEGHTRYWAREEPVPPLPTAPYTVIRATFPDGLDYDLILRDAGWAYVGGGLPRTDMIRGITGFEVLAEPRASTTPSP